MREMSNVILWITVLDVAEWVLNKYALVDEEDMKSNFNDDPKIDGGEGIWIVMCVR